MRDLMLKYNGQWELATVIPPCKKAVVRLQNTNPGTNRQPITVEVNVAFILVRRQTAVKVIRGPIHKISYDNLTIISR